MTLKLPCFLFVWFWLLFHLLFFAAVVMVVVYILLGQNLNPKWFQLASKTHYVAKSSIELLILLLLFPCSRIMAKWTDLARYLFIYQRWFRFCFLHFPIYFWRSFIVFLIYYAFWLLVEGDIINIYWIFKYFLKINWNDNIKLFYTLLISVTVNNFNMLNQPLFL